MPKRTAFALRAWERQ